jgi:hypothetical protein
VATDSVDDHEQAAHVQVKPALVDLPPGAALSVVSNPHAKRKEHPI